MASSRHGEVRTEFSTKEGIYKNIKALEYCRPNKQALFGKELQPVQVSIASCKDKSRVLEWILFNAGREIYLYNFTGLGEVPDLKKPLEKRTYRSPNYPMCHDFNVMTRSTTNLDLVVGFSTGAIQYLNPLAKQVYCAFNEDCSVDSSVVTCIKWVPGSETTFVSSHRSGNLFVWTTENQQKTTGSQNYFVYSEIQDATIYTCKPKNKTPIQYRWTVGHGSINAFAFSPNSTHIAIGSQDGFLRVYNFHNHTMYGRMRSYFGGLLCVCWSPDGKYAVTGGEDDFITVWSFEHRRVVARGEGHRSYVNVVGFDPYTTVLPEVEPARWGSCHSNEGAKSTAKDGHQLQSRADRSSFLLSDSVEPAYRLGSVGQDGYLCLWDLSGDALRLRWLLRGRSRGTSRLLHSDSAPTTPSEVRKEPVTASSLDKIHTKERSANHVSAASSTNKHTKTSVEFSTSSSEEHKSTGEQVTTLPNDADRQPSSSSGNKTEKRSSKGESKKSKTSKQLIKDPMKKMIKFVSGGGGSMGSSGSSQHNYRRPVGSFETCNSDDIAHKMDEVNLIEPLLAKRISMERLTALVFREDCVLTASQEGFVSLWARPNAVLQSDHTDVDHQNFGPSNPPGINSPKPGGQGSIYKDTAI